MQLPKIDIYLFCLFVLILLGGLYLARDSLLDLSRLYLIKYIV